MQGELSSVAQVGKSPKEMRRRLNSFQATQSVILQMQYRMQRRNLLRFVSLLLSDQQKVLALGVGVLLAADSQSTSSSGYRASLWGP
jgi:hypothetical protein